MALRRRTLILWRRVGQGRALLMSIGIRPGPLSIGIRHKPTL
jgi:hypothetical protein